jgi:hypothetical protein
MRDGLAAGHLLLRALDIDMDPLVVAGRLREGVDALLGDVDPLARVDFLADALREFREGLLL